MSAPRVGLQLPHVIRHVDACAQAHLGGGAAWPGTCVHVREFAAAGAKPESADDPAPSGQRDPNGPSDQQKDKTTKTDQQPRHRWRMLVCAQPAEVIVSLSSDDVTR